MTLSAESEALLGWTEAEGWDLRDRLAAIEAAAATAERERIESERCPDCKFSVLEVGRIHITAQTFGRGDNDHIRAAAAAERERIAAALPEALKEVMVDAPLPSWGYGVDPDTILAHSAFRAILEPAP